MTVMNASADILAGQRQDREHTFILVLIALIWAAIIGGFAPEIVEHLRSNARPYPYVVHFHAAAFCGWLILVTVQVLLIGAGRRRLHMKLGIAGAMLAGTMIVLGPLTALIVQRWQLGTPDSYPAFLSTQVTDIIIFAGLVLTGLLLNTNPASHKRLLLLATVAIADAGFGRITGVSIETRYGVNFWPAFADDYGNDLLLIAIGVYDWLARRRLYPVYVKGSIWILAWQSLAVWLYITPGWTPIALRMIGP
jgi:hypothetical protein